MAEDKGSDAAAEYELRMKKIEDTVQLRLPELSNSVSQVNTREDSREKLSSVASSCTKEVNELIEDLPASASAEKVKCHLTEENRPMLALIGEDKVVLCDSARGSFCCDENTEDCGRRNGTSVERLQGTKDSVFDVVSDSQCKNSMLKSDEVREIVIERNDEFDGSQGLAACKSMEVHEDSGIEEAFFRVDSRESENVLEAKKKQLLAKVDAAVGLSGNLKGNDEPVCSSLKVEVTDDTALVAAVSVPENGGRLNVVERSEKKDVKQEADGKKAKRSRRKGKNGKKDLETCDMPMKMPHFFQFQNGDQRNGNNGRKYAREEMEALRFVNIAEQKKMWKYVCACLGDVAMKEYKGLACLRDQRKSHFNCDPSQRIGRKEDATGILREACPEKGDAESHTTEEHQVDNTRLVDSGFYEGMRNASSTVEEVYYEEDDSDEEYASIQRPAFQVEGEPDFDSGPPEDGWEYLRRVRWEASHIPKVTVAKRDKSKFNKEQSVYMPQIPEIDKCPSHLLPSTEWEQTFLADFSELRKLLSYNEDHTVDISSKMQSFSIAHEQNTSSHELSESTILEKFNDMGTDEIHCSGLLDDSFPKIVFDQQYVANSEGSSLASNPQNTHPNSTDDPSSDYPRLSAVLAMDAVARVSMLRKRISLVENAAKLSKNECVWLFALCAAVDTPLDADTSAALRSLLRKCASLQASKAELDDEVIMLNILATISGKFFGQLDT